MYHFWWVSRGDGSILGGVFVFYRFQKFVSPVPNTKSLKITEYVDIRVLQLSTKFQAVILTRKKL